MGVVGRSAAAAADRLGVVARLCVVALRSDDPALTADVARAAVRHRADGVTGFDLAGFEAANPDPRVHAEAFSIARSGGLGVTVHAGELLDDGTLVRRALAVGPDRIAHGASAIADRSVVEELVRRGVTLDLCPTSNVQAGTVDRFADHPLARLARAGVGVTIGTDDTTISDITLSEELLSCHTELGMGLDEVWRCTLHALDAGFVEDDVRADLRAEFERWASHVPELR
jgi:adenosine deaminase